MDTALQPIPDAAAAKYYALSHFMYQARETCAEKCVVDFQQKDIGAMEKECANACIAKHLTLANDIVKANRGKI